MNFENHCQECIEKLGKPYEEVHNWLDEFCKSDKYKMRHRKVRHHLEGINKVINLFGEEAGKAAKIHIESDLKEEGDILDHFPLNEKDYVNMGLF